MGFTITELMVATAISFITVTVAGQALISHLNTTQTAEAIERQRNDWSRTSKFIESEISLAERIITDFNAVDIPNSCTFDSSEFRIALHLRQDIPLVMYGVRTSDPDWLGDNSLWRCGPSFNDDGSYANTVDWSLIVDGLTSTAAGGGFSETTNGKHTELNLSIKGLSSKDYSMTIGAKARIHKLYSAPNDNSLCGLNITDKVNGTVNTGDDLREADGDYNNPSGNPLGDPLIVCGLGGDDTIIGRAGRDIIEAGDLGASSLSGGQGDDHLRGSNDDDTILGGDGDDVLLGRDGDDDLQGGDGDNQYRPGDGDDTITGGSNLDIIFIDGDLGDFTLSSPCTRTSCIVTNKTNSNNIKTITGGEVIVFDDAKEYLYD